MKKVIVAIDFGTSGTTYAFAFREKKDEIIMEAMQTNKIKNPTEIILNDVFEVIKFGDECKDYLGDQSSSEKKFYYFKDIKMELYKNKNEIAPQNCENNNMMPLAMVISRIISKLKNDALSDIKSRDPLIEESDIDWRVTVPAIWDNASKDIMKRACQSAGIFNQNNQSTFFALEPEAAACDYVFNNPNQNSIKPGNIYIVCDIGGGTIDLSTHKRVEENGEIYIEEVFPPIGGDNGSTYINKKFINEVIIKIFGRNAMNKLLEKAKEDHDVFSDYCEFLENIEEFKISISEEKINENEAKRLNCDIFSEFLDERTKVNDLIKNFNNNCKGNKAGWKIVKYSKFRISFPYQIMVDITKEIVVDKVVEYVNEIILNVPYVNSIIYAGSVAQNKFIISMIQQQLTYNIHPYLGSYPPYAVARGAAIFGLNPLIIKSRITRYTIGVCCNEIWDEKRHGSHPEKKFFDYNDNCYKCRDIFSPIIQKNKKIGVNASISHNYIIHNSKVLIEFYKTEYSDDITFVDEKFIFLNKCQKFGELDVDVGDKFDKSDKKLIIELKLGGTFVYSVVKYKNEIRKKDFNFTKVFKNNY